MLRVGNVELTWLGHSGFRLTDVLENRVIYVDPFRIKEGVKADAILITHPHYDHCSIEDLQKISTSRTVIIAPPDCQSKFQGKLDFRDCRILAPGKSIMMGNIGIEAVPAYNTDKEFHPKDNDWVGYIIDMNSKRIYHSGDTDATIELADLNKIDVAIVPVSGNYVMTAEEAAEAVNRLEPKLAIPMHFGAIVGDQTDAEKFKRLCDVPVKILERE